VQFQDDAAAVPLPGMAETGWRSAAARLAMRTGANLGGGHDVDVSELRYFMKNNL
jgi:hypothetical protein